VRKILIPSALLVLVVSCSLPGAAAPSSNSAPQPMNVGSLETAVVLTAAAAQTQTAAVLPSNTPTLTPSATPTLQTPTPTFIFSVFTETPFIPVETTDPSVSSSSSGAPFTVGGSTSEPIPYSGKPWTCVVRGTSPPRWSVIEAGKEFYITWTVLNTGTKNWTINTIDFVYTGGYRHEGTKIQDLWKNVPSGRTVNLQAFYKAPKVAGEYRVYWTLQVGNHPFCGMTAMFEVRE
jgi:hypothetical protein